MTGKSTALVLGASRGLGLGLAQEWCGRGWNVIATRRRASPGLEALTKQYPDTLEVETADIDYAESVRALRSRLDRRRLDVLFLNAGVSYSPGATPAKIQEGAFLGMMLTNVLAPARAAEIFEDIVAPDGVIAAMSSGLGSISQSGGNWELYSASKAALNMLMKCFAAKRADSARAILLVAPGWVRTDMGGSHAALSVEESVAGIVAMVRRRGAGQG